VGSHHNVPVVFRNTSFGQALVLKIGFGYCFFGKLKIFGKKRGAKILCLGGKARSTKAWHDLMSTLIAWVHKLVQHSNLTDKMNIEIKANIHEISLRPKKFLLALNFASLNST
jgi:hypothetical protein